MTARSLELIGARRRGLLRPADPAGALDGAREDAELVYVGKQPGVPSVPQEEIGERLVEAARAGRSVVRLKGGDPFVFGRGGEEGEALRAAGVEFEVVPGVTAGVAATAYAGIPVTHRDDASAVAFVTGHEDPEKTESALDWEALAAFPGTLVFYMGVKRLARERGGADRRRPRPGGAGGGDRTRHAGRASERSTATLRTIHEAVELARVEAPALIVVGPVAARREELAWLERRPLHGAPRRRHPRPRPGQRPGGDPARARRRGRRAAGDPDRAAARAPTRCARRRRRSASYALVCLTSPNGVRLLFEAMAGGRPRRARARRRHRRGDRPRHRARRWPSAGSAPTSSPSASSPRALIEALAEVEVEGRRVLVARAAEARDVLPEYCASAAPRSTSSPSTRPCASSPTRRRSRPPRTPTTSPSPPPRP